MIIRIVSWNMDYWKHQAMQSQAWDYFLNGIKADIYLFQEANPTKEIKNQEANLVWEMIGQSRNWGSGIYSQKYKLAQEELDTQFKGSFVVGNTKSGHSITFISLYGLMESNGPCKGYSITNLHRIISDLTGLFNGHIGGNRKTVMGGDLNASMQLDDIQGNRSHQIFFDRIEDFGLNDVYKLSDNKDYVQTLRHARSKKPWQNDYFFISNSLKGMFLKYEIIDNREVRRFSDHNIVLIEMDF